jgi:molecular chaperone DnaK
MSDAIIGIDLGTTNSEVAIVQDGKVVVIDEGGQPILPSVVGIGDDGAILVGEAARNQYALYPERTVRSIKRRMGSEEKVEMAGAAYAPQEISAMILKRLKGIAEAHLGQPVRKAVITVPAYFSDAQRQATREAGEIAGLEVVRMINEPTAAALSYEAEHRAHKRVLVYDLGGGTFDVSVVSIEDNVVEVVASHGNNHLGGDDFDQKLTDHVAEHLGKRHSGYDPHSDRRAMARLVRAAEAAKIVLSDQPYVSIEEEFLAEREGAPIHLSLEVSRDEYEAMIAPYIDETLEAVHIALRDAGLTASDVDGILLVGGATRTPLVSRRLEEEFRLRPRAEVHPELCVAMGAAIQAQMISGGEVSAVLVDVTPYTFGTSAVGELDGELTPHMYVPIIRKNTPIPVAKTEAFYTLHDNQKAVDVNIYQGEDPDALNNIPIGQFLVEGLSRAEAGNPILVRLDLDLNGILHVSAREKNTGLEKSITIDNAISRFEHGELQQARQRVNALFGAAEAQAGEPGATAEDAALKHASVQAAALVEKAERMLDQATPEDRDDMINLIESIRDAIEAGDHAAVKGPVEELSEILYYLES